MESVAKIRHMYYVKGLKIKQISRKLNIARNTVKKVLKTNDPKMIYRRDKAIACKLGPHIEDLKKLLEKDMLLPVKRRCTAKRLHELLQERGYDGAYDSVQRYVKSWWEKGGTLRVKGYIPLYFAPGEAYQFDWSQEIVNLDGIDQRIHVAHIRLCYS